MFFVSFVTFFSLVLRVVVSANPSAPYFNGSRSQLTYLSSVVGYSALSPFALNSVALNGRASSVSVVPLPRSTTARSSVLKSPPSSLSAASDLTNSETYNPSSGSYGSVIAASMPRPTASDSFLSKSSSFGSLASSSPFSNSSPLGSSTLTSSSMSSPSLASSALRSTTPISSSLGFSTMVSSPTRHYNSHSSGAVSAWSLSSLSPYSKSVSSSSLSLPTPLPSSLGSSNVLIRHSGSLRSLPNSFSALKSLTLETHTPTSTASGSSKLSSSNSHSLFPRVTVGSSTASRFSTKGRLTASTSSNFKSSAHGRPVQNSAMAPSSTFYSESPYSLSFSKPTSSQISFTPVSTYILSSLKISGSLSRGTPRNPSFLPSSSVKFLRSSLHRIVPSQGRNLSEYSQNTIHPSGFSVSDILPTRLSNAKSSSSISASRKDMNSFPDSDKHSDFNTVTLSEFGETIPSSVSSARYQSVTSSAGPSSSTRLAVSMFNADIHTPATPVTSRILSSEDSSLSFISGLVRPSSSYDDRIAFKTRYPSKTTTKADPVNTSVSVTRKVTSEAPINSESRVLSIGAIANSHLSGQSILPTSLSPMPVSSRELQTVHPKHASDYTVVSRYTTYCAIPTTFSYKGQIVNVSTPVTITVTDCPCTLTRSATSGSWALIPETSSIKLSILSATELQNSSTRPTSFTGDSLDQETTTIRVTRSALVSAGQTSSVRHSAATPRISQVPLRSTKPTLTTTVSALTIVCTTPTTFTINSKTYDIASFSTMTIYNCVLTRDGSPSASWRLSVDAESVPKSSTSLTTETGDSKTAEKNSMTTFMASSFTTEYSSPTTVTFNSNTYSITGPTTLTVTDCPCTLSRKVKQSSSSTELSPSSHGEAKTDSRVTPLSASVFRGESHVQTRRRSATLSDSSALTAYPGSSMPSSTYDGHIGNTIEGSSGRVPIKETNIFKTTASGYATSSQAYLTTVLSSFTTYCPSPTTLTYKSRTYTISSPSTLTVTDCPCTLSYSNSNSSPGKSLELTPASFYGGSSSYTDKSTHTPSISRVSDSLISPQSPSFILFTTFCPSPTTFTIDSSTYTATGASSFTINRVSSVQHPESSATNTAGTENQASSLYPPLSTVATPGAATSDSIVTLSSASPSTASSISATTHAGLTTFTQESKITTTSKPMIPTVINTLSTELYIVTSRTQAITTETSEPFIRGSPKTSLVSIQESSISAYESQAVQLRPQSSGIPTDLRGATSLTREDQTSASSATMLTTPISLAVPPDSPAFLPPAERTDEHSTTVSTFLPVQSKSTGQRTETTVTFSGGTTTIARITRTKTLTKQSTRSLALAVSNTTGLGSSSISLNNSAHRSSYKYLRVLLPLLLVCVT